MREEKKEKGAKSKVQSAHRTYIKLTLKMDSNIQ